VGCKETLKVERKRGGVVDEVWREGLLEGGKGDGGFQFQRVAVDWVSRGVPENLRS